MSGHEYALANSNTYGSAPSRSHTWIRIFIYNVNIRRLQDLYNAGTRDGYKDSDELLRSVDYMGMIIDCNQTYLDNLDYKKDEVVGISLYEHTASRSNGNLHANMENWRAGHISASKIWMRRKDGSEFLTLLSVTNETDKDGTIVGRTVALKPVET